MRPIEGPPAPGAVIVISGGETAETARGRATQAFPGTAPQVFAEAPLTIAFAPDPHRQLHVSDQTLCLLEGTLYEPTTAAELVRGYEREGDRLLPRVRGEYWALLWRRHERGGVIVCDQLGCRAPYWTRDGSRLVVASEIPELLATLSHQPDADPVELAHWLMITGPRAGRTLLAGVRSIKAGYLLRVGPRAATPDRYWSPTPEHPFDSAPRDQAHALGAALETAVRRRHIPPSTTGVLLSGGLDSSAVAALAASEQPVAAYSAVFPDHPGMDEAQLIDLTARSLGIESTRIVVRGGSTLTGAVNYIRSWQVPPTSPNLFFWAPLLERAATDGIDVMLDGEGGDELFGFSPFLLADRLCRGRLLSALRLARHWPGETRPPSRELVWYRLREAGIKPLLPPAAHRISRRRHGLDHYAPAWLPRALAVQWLASEDSSFSWKQISGPRWWAYVVYLVTQGAGPSAVYEQARRRCRAAGIEPRHPLVDIDVIDVALRLDPELAFGHRFNRPMLREAIAGRVPDDVRLRRGKSNFDALFHQLLAGPELPAVRQLLEPRAAKLGAYVDVGFLYRELLEGDPRSQPEGLMQWAIRVWRLATAELWLRVREDPWALERLDRNMDLRLAEPVFEVRRPG